MTDKATAHFNKMTKTPIAKLIVTLGIPSTISMLITNIYNMADTYFVGTLGESATGAIGILFALQGFIQAVAFMLGHGSGTFVAKELADKDVDRASEYVSSAFFLGGAIGVAVLVFGLVFLTPLMRLLGSTETILPHAEDYGMWVFISAPFMICSLILNNNLRYEGKAAYSMIGLSTGAALNILLDYIFINLTGLGVFGAGMATAISQTVSFVLLLIIYIKSAQSRISFKYVSRGIITYFAIAKVGFPSLLRQGLMAISGSALNNLARPYGDSAIAGMSIVGRYSSLVTCLGLGIGQGFQPVASFNYEVKEYGRVKEGLFVTMGIGVVLVSVLSLFGGIFAEEAVRLFQDEPEVVEIGSLALIFASCGLPFMALTIPVNMLYQSIRNAKVASFLALLRSGAILIPVLFFSAHIFGLTGIQFAQPLADILTALCSAPFIFIFVRKHKTEHTPPPYEENAEPYNGA